MIKKWIFLTSLLLCYCVQPRQLKKKKFRPDYKFNIAIIDSLFKSENYDILRVECSRRLSDKHNDFPSLSCLNFYLGQSYFNENVDSSIFYFEKSAFYAEKMHSLDDIVKADVYLLMLYNRCIGDSGAKTQHLFNKLDSLSNNNVGLKNKMLLFTGLAYHYKFNGKEQLYLSTLFKTASYSEQFAATGKADNTDSNNVGITYLNIGRYYFETNQIGKAMEYYQLSSLWLRDYKRGLAGYYRGVMNLYLMRNDLGRAQLYKDSMHALLYEKDGGVVEVVMRADIDLAYYYLSKMDINAAWKCYEFSNQFIKVNPNEVIRGRMKLLAALLFIKEKKYKDALPYLISIKEEVRRWPLDEYVPYFEIVAECYVGLKDYRKADDNYHIYLKLSDSLNNKNLKQSLAFAEAEYQNEKKQTEINNQKFVIKLVQEQRLWLVSAISTLVILLLLIFIFYSGKKKYARILNLRNIELLKLNVQLEEANKTKATLFGILSHDLRAPISDVYQLMKIRHWELLGTEEKEILEEEIRSGTASLLEMLEDMLIWSKTQLDAIHTEIQDVEIDKIFKQCQNLMQLNIQARAIRIVNRIGPKNLVKTDPNFLQIIIRNLLQNGIKASPYNSIIEVGFCISKDCKPCFWITNSGPPFSQKDYLEILQKKNTSKNIHQGLGLKLVEELSRRIGLEVRFDIINKSQTCCTLFFN